MGHFVTLAPRWIARLRDPIGMSSQNSFVGRRWFVAVRYQLCITHRLLWDFFLRQSNRYRELSNSLGTFHIATDGSVILWSKDTRALPRNLLLQSKTAAVLTIQVPEIVDLWCGFYPKAQPSVLRITPGNGREH